MSDDQVLISTRNLADQAITHALIWIERFHKQASTRIIGRLTTSIRDLTRAMQSRDPLLIRSRLEALMSVTEDQEVLLIGNSTPSNAPQLVLSDTYSHTTLTIPTDEELKCKKEKLTNSVFVSYARADAMWLNRVKIHLRPLERAGRLSLWHDGTIETGEDWKHRITLEIERASCAILLVSSHYMASDFIYENELPPIVRRACSGGVTIFPVIVGHCLFNEDDILSRFQSFNNPDRPLSSIGDSDIDKHLTGLAKEVSRISNALT